MGIRQREGHNLENVQVKMQKINEKPNGSNAASAGRGTCTGEVSANIGDSGKVRNKF